MMSHRTIAIFGLIPLLLGLICVTGHIFHAPLIYNPFETTDPISTLGSIVLTIVGGLFSANHLYSNETVKRATKYACLGIVLLSGYILSAKYLGLQGSWSALAQHALSLKNGELSISTTSWLTWILVAHLILAMIREENKRILPALEAFTFVLLFIGTVGLVLAGKHFLLIHTWLNHFLLSPPLAASFILLAVGLMNTWVKIRNRDEDNPEREEHQMVVFSGFMLAQGILTAGLFGFSILASQNESFLKNSLEQQMSFKSESIDSFLQGEIDELGKISSYKNITNLFSINKSSVDETISELKPIFEGNKISAWSVVGKRGEILFKSGEFKNPPIGDLRINKFAKAHLKWDNDWFINMSIPIKTTRGETLGDIEIEKNLSIIGQFLGTGSILSKAENNFICTATPDNTYNCFASGSIGNRSISFEKNSALSKSLMLNEAGNDTALAHQTQNAMGQDVIIVKHPLKSIDMSLITHIDLAETQRDALMQFRYALPAFFIFLFFCMSIVNWHLLPLAQRSKRSEQTAKENERLFRSLVENAPIGKVLFKSDYSIIQANKALCKLLGYSGPEMLTLKILDLLPESQREHGFEPLFRLIENGMNQLEAEVDFVNVSGETISTHMNLSQILDTQQNRLFYIAQIQDGSIRKQYEAELKEANNMLKNRYTEMETLTRETHLLNEMSGILQSCSSSEEAYDPIGKFAAQLFPQTSGCLYIAQRGSNHMEIATQWGNPLFHDKHLNNDECWALRRGQIYYIENTQDEISCHHTHHQKAITSHLCMPLFTQNETMGLLYFEAHEPGENSEESIITDGVYRAATSFMDQLALALSNIRLRETLQHQSLHDPLTGLYNRRYFDEAIRIEHLKSSRTNTPYSLLILDIDHFKHVNDTYGHEAGDVVLQEISKTIKKHIRDSDIACRLGGEEFVIILPGMAAAVAEKRAEIIRNTISKLKIKVNAKSINKITVSIGVASFPDHAVAPNILLESADTALYTAKRSGRDRVITADAA